MNILATLGEIQGTGTSARAAVSNLRMETPPQEVDLSGDDALVGKVTFAVDADLLALPIGASFKVTKNRLIRLALKGSKYENLTEMFAGPTAIAFSSDPVSAAKVAVKFAKKNKKLVVLGGGLGEKTLDVKAVRELASLPSIDQLRAKLIQLVMIPATRITQLSQGPSSAIVQVLRARAESK